MIGSDAWRRGRDDGWRIAALAVVGLGLWALKRYYAGASAPGLAFVLAPTARLVALVSGKHFELEPGTGHLCRECLFAITKACAGINFLVAAWGMLAFVWSRRARGPVSCGGVALASGACAYIAAVLVNAVRILLAIPLAAHPFVSDFWTGARVHRAEGIVVYFGGLALLHALASRTAPVSRAVVDALRRSLVPLLFYYAIALGVPLACGAEAGAGALREHGFFVLPIPLVVLAIIGAVRGGWRTWARLWQNSP
jgi:exosortase K